MNKYWGRNEYGSAPVFSRDDEQILALNYENLCDGDYLNRLFVNDLGVTDKASSPDDQTGNICSDGSILNSDLAEDIIIFGDSIDVGRMFCSNRFSKELSGSLKNSDSITNVVSRQTTVFEHMGKLMLERCLSAHIPKYIPPKDDILLKLRKKSPLTANALTCALKMLRNNKCYSLQVNYIESLISILFQSFYSANVNITEESIINVPTWSAEHICSIRAAFNKEILNSLAICGSGANHQTTEENLKLALCCFYGMFALGLWTKSPAELFLSVSHLMNIMIKAEEWQERFINESKATILSTTGEKPSSVKQPIRPKQNTNSNSKIPSKSNTHQQKEAVKPLSRQVPKEQVVNEDNRDDISSSNQSTSIVSLSNTTTTNNSTNGNNTVVIYDNNMKSSHNKTWDKSSNKNPAIEKDKESSLNKSKIQSKQLKNEKVSGDLPLQQENDYMNAVAAAAANNTTVQSNQVTINHVTVTYTNNSKFKNINQSQHHLHNKDKDNTNNTSNHQSTSHPQKSLMDDTQSSKLRGNKSSNNLKGNNQHHNQNQQLTPGGNNNNSGNNTNNFSSMSTSEKSKREIKEFKTSLQNLFLLPKSMVKMLYHCSVSSSVELSPKTTTTSKPKEGANDSNNNNNSATTSVSSSVAKSISKTKKSFSTYVWSCGQNNYGELGIGDSQPAVTSYTPVTVLNDKCIVSIGAGNEHSLFVTKDGKLLTAGYNENGQCGSGNSQQLRDPTVNTALEGEEISHVHVYNGCEHTMVVTKDGRVFAFGYNYRGQLGLGNTSSEFAPRPLRALLSRKVTLAGCSYHHSVLLCADGSLFSCGRNDSGQLGHGDTIDKKTPQLVLNCPRGITSISCGQFHTVAGTAAGLVYVCGKNDYGQLGLDNGNIVKTLTKTPNNPEMDTIVQVCCGYYHTLLLSNHGIVAGFGRNDYGQLGLGHSQSKVFQSTIITSLRDKGVTMVSAGCYHSAIVTSNGMLYVFGRNNHGQLGTGDLEERHSPHPVDEFVGQRIVSVAAGFYHTLVLVVDPNTVPPEEAHLLGANCPTISESLLENSSQALLQTMKDSASTTAIDQVGSQLLKDITMLTEMTPNPANQSKNIIFSLENHSTVPNRDMLHFLMNHIDQLMIVESKDNVIEEKNKKDNEELKSKELIEIPRSFAWIYDTMSGIVSIMELSLKIIEDTHEHNKLPISQDDSLLFMTKLVHILNQVLKYNKNTLLCCLQQQQQNQEDEDNAFELYSNRVAPRKFNIDLFWNRLMKEENNDFELTKSKEFSNNREEMKLIRYSIYALRQILLEIYFTLQAEEDKKVLYQELVTEIATCITKYHDVFLHIPSAYSHFFTLLNTNIFQLTIDNKSQANLSPELQKLNQHQQQLHLKMLILFCTLYRNNDEVVKLFQQSKFEGLSIFKQMLKVYGFFSKQSLEKRLQHSTMANQIDVRRILSILEHTIANFVKCAVPIIFSSSVSSKTDACNCKLYEFGVEIINEVLIDADTMLDYLLSQSLSDEAMNQLRYGTIMPSILPSVLIYGISFTKFGCVALEIMPQLKSLIKKLQQIGKSEIQHNSSNNGSSTNNATITPSKNNASSHALLTSTDKKGTITESSKAALTPDNNNTPTKEEETIEVISEDISSGKKESQNITWWSRLLKLSINLLAKSSSSLIYQTPNHSLHLFVSNFVQPKKKASTDSSRELKQLLTHELWSFVSLPSNVQVTDDIAIVSALTQSIDMDLPPEEITNYCLSHRDQIKSVDPMYKMLSQSSQALFSNNIFYAIEEVIVHTVFWIYGWPSAKYPVHDTSFKLVTRFTKLIHTKRSILVSNCEGISWVEILSTILNVVKYVCNMVRSGKRTIQYRRNELIYQNSANSCAKVAFKRVMLTIIGMIRWRRYKQYNIKSHVQATVDFIQQYTMFVTENLCTVNLNKIKNNITDVSSIFHESNVAVQDYTKGLNVMLSLLEDVTSVLMKIDVMNVLITSLKDKFEHRHDMSCAHQCCTQDSLQEMTSIHLSLVLHVSKLIISSSVLTLTQNELQLLTLASKFMQLMLVYNEETKSTLSLETISQLIIQLNDKYKTLVNNIEDKTITKKIPSVRERNSSFRKASYALMSYLQSLTLFESYNSVYSKPHVCFQILSICNQLLSYFQKSRIESIKNEALIDQSLRANESGKDSSKNANSKENNKRRCQDLILKPMEFCKNVDGVVVLAEKLISSFKGTDFTIAFWIQFSKKTTMKQIFITGKMSHNDVWPLIFLRNDGKLELQYGLNNEFDKFTSEATIQYFVWTHVAVVCEQKKIKLFINGVQDCMASPTKANNRAVMYPLVIGTCPSGVRTRIPGVRDGFDGLIAQYKYYSRGLSPIHLKVIFDNGPPETSDISEKLMYQTLASMKCLLPIVNKQYLANQLSISASISFELFVTETSRRARFAALDILKEILCLNAIDNLFMNSHSVVGETTIQKSTTMLECDFLQEYNGFHEKCIAYFIRLAGSCWAPHNLIDIFNDDTLNMLNNLNTGSGANASSSQRSNMNENQRQELEELSNSIDQSDRKLHEFLNYIPNFLSKDNATTSLSSLIPGTNVSNINANVDNVVAREEIRGEICHNVLKLLCKLSKDSLSSSIWQEALSSVIFTIMKTCCGNIEQLEPLNNTHKVDIMGVVMLLGGGATGTYLGATIKNFFSDNLGTILNVNKTTNNVTLLSLNAIGDTRQLIRVRQSDIIHPENNTQNETLPLTSLNRNVLICMMHLLNALSSYVPLLLSDYLALYKPEHSFQCKTMLKCFRPIELFLYSQLLQAFTNSIKNLEQDDLLLSEISNLYVVIQQACVATLRLDQFEEVQTTSLSGMWSKCSNYLSTLPDTVLPQKFLLSEDIRSYNEFINKYFGLNIEAINSVYDHLLKQGRLSELVQKMAIGNVCLGGGSGVEEILVNNNPIGMMNIDGKEEHYHLMSDWSSTPSAIEWSLLHDHNLSELDYFLVLRFLYYIRKRIVINSRQILSKYSTYNIDLFHKKKLSWKVVLWESLLPLNHSTIANNYSWISNFSKNFYSAEKITWSAIAEQFFTFNKVEITQFLASSLNYSSRLLLLKSNNVKSEDNILETTDIFKRILHSMFLWVEFNSIKNQTMDIYFPMLKTVLQILSFVDSIDIELQLMQVCSFIIHKIILLLLDGQRPSKDLTNLVKSNVFTLLRARAQEQIMRFKSHNLGNISQLAYNLTQLVTGLEMIQRQSAITEYKHNFPNGLILADSTTTTTSISVKLCTEKNTKHNLATLAAKIVLVETACPKVVGVRSTSVDTDLAGCITPIIPILMSDPATASQLRDSDITDNLLIEVALATGATASDCYFDSVYCGSSLRFVQSGLAPDCTYYMKCRAYVGNMPMAWSSLVEFKTETGILFTFDSMKSGPDIVISEDGSTASYAADDTWSTILATRSFSSGITHWEIRINQSATAYVFVGVASSQADLNSFLGGCPHGWGFIGEQALYHNREKVKIYGDSFSSGDIIGITLDLNVGILRFSKNRKDMGIAFEKLYGELYPAVAFYNAGQELEILSDGFKTTSYYEPIPVSPSRLNIDDISILNELVLSLYYNHPLSQRMLVMIAEHCNQWCNPSNIRYRTITGRDIVLNKEGALLKKFGLVVGERVRTYYGVAEVAGTGFNRVWFKMNPIGEVWYFSNQQITDGKAKKYFIRCSYDNSSSSTSNKDSHTTSTENATTTTNGSSNNMNPSGANLLSTTSHGNVHNRSTDNLSTMSFDAMSIQELLEPNRWSEEMDNILLHFLSTHKDSDSDSHNNDNNHHEYQDPWRVSTDIICDSFRILQQQFSRIMLNSHDLAHKWGISGPKRKAVIARIGMLRVLNQLLDMYLPFMISDVMSKPFAADMPAVNDDFSPLISSLSYHIQLQTKANNNSSQDQQMLASSSLPIEFSWKKDNNKQRYSKSLFMIPLHAIRKRIFPKLKYTHYWEIIKKSTTRPAKTEDDYDYPEDLPHVKINRLKSYRAIEASELLHIPGEDMLFSTKFIQLYRELRQHNTEKLRISYTHPMDDGQSRTFKVKFDGEGVDDYGGPYREIFQKICEELQLADPSTKNKQAQDVIMNQKHAKAHGKEDKKSQFTQAYITEQAEAMRCFIPILLPTLNWTAEIECAERYRYTLNPSSTSPLKLDLYHFLGQMIGIAIRSKITLDLPFASYIWKYLVCETLTENDIASFDIQAYDFISRISVNYKKLIVLQLQGQNNEQQQSSIETNKVADTQQKNEEIYKLEASLNELIADITWTATRSDGQVIELIENGSNIPVKLQDIGRYLELYVECRLNESKLPLDALRNGLVSIIPESSLSLLTGEECQFAICGSKTIDVQRLKDNTEYDDDISPDDAHIQMFWEVLAEFTEEEKSAYLKFVWARPTLPPIGVEFSQKMRILSAVGDDATLKPDQYLPKAHTCFFSLNLPKYSNKELMIEKLKYAIYNCSEMDADYKTTETDVAGWDSATNNASTDWQPLIGRL